MDQVEQNGKTYVLGDPRAYVVIMKTEGFSLSMSMLSNIKFRIDFDEDRGPEDQVVMTEEVSTAYNVLKKYMKNPGSRRGYATSKPYDARETEVVIELLESAKDVLTPVIPFEEIIAPVKTLQNFYKTLEEMTQEAIPEDVAKTKEEIDEIEKEMEDLQKRYNELLAKRADLVSGVSSTLREARESSLKKLQEDGLEESMQDVMAPFNATTDGYVYKEMQSRGVPGILVGPQAKEVDPDDFDSKGDEDGDED